MGNITASSTESENVGAAGWWVVMVILCWVDWSEEKIWKCWYGCIYGCLTEVLKLPVLPCPPVSLCKPGPCSRVPVPVKPRRSDCEVQSHSALSQLGQENCCSQKQHEPLRDRQCGRSGQPLPLQGWQHWRDSRHHLRQRDGPQPGWGEGGVR